MAVDDLGEDFGEVAERLDLVELAGLDEGGDDGPVFGAASLGWNAGLAHLADAPPVEPPRATPRAARPSAASRRPQPSASGTRRPPVASRTGTCRSRPRRSA